MLAYCTPTSLRRGNAGEILKHERNPVLDGDALNLDEFISIFGVGRHHRLISLDCLFETLFALAILPEDDLPWRQRTGQCKPWRLLGSYGPEVGAILTTNPS